MKLKIMAVATLALGCTAANSLSFDEAIKVCESYYKSMQNIQDDGDATFSGLNRFNVAFELTGTKFVCSVGKDTGEVEQVKTGKFTFDKEELQQTFAKRKAEAERKAKIVQGDHADFVNQAKRAITRSFKDPESAKFRDLYLSDKELPTLCGEVNAKNSYGAYVGYRGFFYNSLMSYLDDGKELGEGFMYRKLQPDSCGKKFADVTSD